MMEEPVLNFFWIIHEKLAGSELPTSKGDFQWLKAQGIKAIVPLTEKPPDPVLVRAFGFELYHLPLRDRTAPKQHQIDTFVKTVNNLLTKNKTVLVHCLGGVGRTGTMLACYLVSLCKSPRDAITEVRRKNPGSIHLRSQVLSIFEYARRLGKETS